MLILEKKTINYKGIRSLLMKQLDNHSSLYDRAICTIRLAFVLILILTGCAAEDTGTDREPYYQPPQETGTDTQTATTSG